MIDNGLQRETMKDLIARLSDSFHSDVAGLTCSIFMRLISAFGSHQNLVNVLLGGLGPSG
jgi:hypothetical protein